MDKVRRVTIKDIAAEAGISAQAVSRALGDKADISPETKKKVREIAARLHYVKNSAASSLRHGGTKVVAVVYDNPVNLYFSFMTAYLHESLKARGYSMLMIMEPVRRLDGRLYRSVLSRNVDGILSFIEPSEEIGSLTEIYGVPFVLVGRRSEVRNVDCIYTDDVKGGALAAGYLADRGAKRIVLLSEKTDLTCARDRFEGFKKELTSRGLFDPALCLFTATEKAGACWEDFLSRKPSFDGVFCFSDYLAYETLTVFARHGIKASVVGYDGVREKIPVPFHLPSVGSDKRGIAEFSVSFLLDKIALFNKNGGDRDEMKEENDGGTNVGKKKNETRKIKKETSGKQAGEQISKREKIFDVYLTDGD